MCTTCAQCKDPSIPRIPGGTKNKPPPPSFQGPRHDFASRNPTSPSLGTISKRKPDVLKSHWRSLYEHDISSLHSVLPLRAEFSFSPRLAANHCRPVQYYKD